MEYKSQVDVKDEGVVYLKEGNRRERESNQSKQWYTFHKFVMLGKRKSWFRHAIRNDQRDEHTSCKFVIIKTSDLE